jgi:transcriptional regulator of acetoin/glycerol metabolism
MLHASENGGDAGPRRELIEQDYSAAKRAILEAFEREYVSAILEETDANVSRAAELAGVDRTTLYRKIEKHGLAMHE